MHKSTLSSIQLSKINYFRKKLLQWYASNQRVFTWRLPERSCYEIIIAEILLQRTRSETVQKFYEEFIQQYPDWHAIDNAALTEIEISLKPFGLWQQRSIRLKELARVLVENDGVLPKRIKKLHTLPLFGQYITNAVLTQCYQQRKPFLDASMARLLERFFGPRKLVDIRYDPYLQELAHRVINKRDLEDVKRLNWAILDFAAIICKKKTPNCQMCSLRKNCLHAETLNT